MALPIWGIYMKKCYGDASLDISDKGFRRPSGLSIETNCAEFNKVEDVDENIPDEFDF